MEKRIVGRGINMKVDGSSSLLVCSFLVWQMRELVAMESVVALTVFAPIVRFRC